MKIDTENPFAECNFTERFQHAFRGDGKMYWRVNCSYRLGDWIEQQDPSEWFIFGGRHRAIYDISDDLLSKIIMLSALTK